MEDLVVKAQAGQEEAFLSLVDKLAPIRKSMMTHFPSLDRDDLDQDLILVLRDCIDSYQKDKAGFAWYVRMSSRYHCLDKLKERTCLSLDQQIEEDLSLMDTMVAEEDVETDYLILCRNKSLKIALRQLSKLEYTVIYLYYFLDMGLAEIGTSLSYSVSHISRVKNKALSKLKKILRKDDKFDY